jgi:hypothetical protein
VINSFARPTGKALLVAALALLAAALLAAGAQATTKVKVIATGQQLTDGKTSYAQVTAKSPTKLAAKVTVKPAQKVKLSYQVVCSKGAAADADGYNASTTPSSASISVTAPITQDLKIPIAHPKSCSVTVYSQLLKKGKATLQILQG